MQILKLSFLVPKIQTYFLRSSTYFSMNKLGPRPLVLCGPSGSGKSTLLKLLFKEFPETFGFSVSHTTRAPRKGEENGVHYYFVSKEEMEKAIKNNEFIEYATFSDNTYGTSKKAIQDVQSQGKVCVLDIEIEGVKQIKKTDLNPIYIFNNPPSIQELENRIRKRKSETEETLKKRLNQAKYEIEYGLTPGNFDLIVHNIDIDKAYAEFRDYILNELEKQVNEGVHVNLKRII